jgi:hypothetical protein
MLTQERYGWNQEQAGAFNFGDSSVRTLDQMQAQGVFDEPHVDVTSMYDTYQKVRMPLRSLSSPTPDPYAHLLDRLDEAKWCHRVTTVYEQVVRKFSARVWKLDKLGSGNKTSRVSRLDALQCAYEDAKRLRHQRAQQGRGEVVSQPSTQETYD